MTLNPALISYPDRNLGPQLYPAESLALSRDSIDINFESQNLPANRWQTRGTLFLTNLRLVFIANKPDQKTGLQAVDIPLAYIRKSKFNQPVFSCNNLAGEVWSTAEQGGPEGSLPPHQFALYFKNGGVGTFLPLFFRLLEAMQAMATQQSRPQFRDEIRDTIATAFVDPSDPSKIILTQPAESDRIPTAPVYAPNYGEEEVYESMDSSRH